MLCWNTHCRWIHDPAAAVREKYRCCEEGKEDTPASGATWKKIYQNLFAWIIVLSPPVAVIIKMLHQLSWLGPAVGVQGWLWPHAEAVALKRGSCGFAASVKLAAQCASLQFHHLSSHSWAGDWAAPLDWLFQAQEPRSKSWCCLELERIHHPEKAKPWHSGCWTCLGQGGAFLGLLGE